MDYKTETQQILRETAEKIKIEDIKTGLLLMAWNLDNLEQEGINKAIRELPSNEKEAYKE